MADLADIARELNVSSSLVSKVLNGRLGTTRVSTKTLRAIHARARGLNYRRNESASALATGRQNVLGVFIHRVGVAGSGIIDAMVQGISAEAARHRQRLVIQFFETMDSFVAQRGIMQRGVMDGVLLGGLNHDELIPLLSEVQDSGLPIVTIHDKRLADRFTNVGMDQHEVGKLATRHLIARGCRRIVHLHKMDERFGGYVAALAEANVPLAPELVFKVDDYEHATGRAVLERLDAARLHYDGVVAQSDQQAVAMINALARRGRRLPNDVKIIGVDNSPFCDFTVVPLSSVSQEEERRGRRAVQLLMDMTTHRGAAPEPREVWLPPVLHARESTAEVA